MSKAYYTDRKYILFDIKTMILSRNIFYFIVTLIVLIKNSNADTDFMKNCGTCSCKWISGKKNADCRFKDMQVIPTGLSSELQVLELSNNLIPELKSDEFTNASLHNLHKLYMRNCTIEEVHINALRGLVILIELDLSNNFIKVLQPGIFSNLIRIRKIQINNNEIKQLDDYLFQNLIFLHTIELKNNHLFKIGLSTFVNLRELSQIHLEGNKLSVLYKDTFKSLDKLTSLSLGQNPWNCTCDLRQFKDFIIDRRLYISPTDCYEPLNSRGKEWTAIDSDKFSCAPIILMPDRAGAVIDTEAENVTLTCRIKGWPKPEISWIYNKRLINNYDQRYQVKDISTENSEYFMSELNILQVKVTDKGLYTCRAENKGGMDEVEIQLSIARQPTIADVHIPQQEKLNMDLIISIVISGVITILLIIIICLICCKCRKSKKYKKNGSISENGLVPMKLDKSQNDSMLEGGSVIMEMQKGLLTEVNPVEKPPRRQLDSSSRNDLADGCELKRTLLDETVFGSHDEETQSIALSDTTPRSRTAYVDDGYGTSLPPDLLTFPSRFPQSPSLQSSVSNIQDGRLYVKSPISSPVYQNPGIYPAQMLPGGFRTLQHPKTGRTIAISANRSNSPFTPAPIMYPPVLMKQGYVTIPRKPRIPSWTPSMNSGISDYPPTSPTSTTISGEIIEPVYDNLGLRTTAAGNSALNINKIGTNNNNNLINNTNNGSNTNNNNSSKFSMKDRPLPETPSIKDGSSLHEKLQQSLNEPEFNQVISDTEPLYGRSGITPVINATGERATKIPPRPPPKPKKRLSVASTGGGIGNNNNSTNQLFEDEGEDGTEV